MIEIRRDGKVHDEQGMVPYVRVRFGRDGTTPATLEINIPSRGWIEADGTEKVQATATPDDLARVLAARDAIEANEGVVVNMTARISTVTITLP
jgi:hypothetical protein